jgi:O-antigen ligase
MNRDQGPSVILVPSEATLGSPTDEPRLGLVLPPALLFSLAVVAGLRDGGFWPSDALAVAILSLLVLAAATAAALLCGAVLGVAAVASSSHHGAVPWLGVVAAAAVGVAVLVPRRVRLQRPRSRVGLVTGVLVLGAVGLVAVVLHHEIGLRALAPSDQDRAVEWSTALHQWASAPIVGVGPDQPLFFHAADGSLAQFVHNEYLQVAADSGLVGLALLGIVAVAILRTIRRNDVLTSSAAAACMCFAVAGGLDFDWHLPVVGLPGGWCTGLAARRVRRGGEP